MNQSTKFADFVAAQNGVYDRVLQELAAGRKETHWMWFIFPQLAGLGFSRISQKFGIASLAEAQAYVEHDVLGARLRECIGLILASANHDATSILGSPDDLKFRSSMTLFRAAAPGASIFDEALQKFYDGQPDPRTIELLRGLSKRDE
jgi:uncharacterized protein (DUF1810 family)